MYGKYTVYKSEAQLGILTMNYNITTEEKYTNSNYLSIHNTGNTKKNYLHLHKLYLKLIYR